MSLNSVSGATLGAAQYYTNTNNPADVKDQPSSTIAENSEPAAQSPTTADGDTGTAQDGTDYETFQINGVTINMPTVRAASWGADLWGRSVAYDKNGKQIGLTMYTVPTVSGQSGSKISASEDYDSNYQYIIHDDYDPEGNSSANEPQSGDVFTYTAKGEYETDGPVDPDIQKQHQSSDEASVQKMLKDLGVTLPEDVSFNIEIVTNQPGVLNRFQVSGTGDSNLDTLIAHALDINLDGAGGAAIDMLNVDHPGTQLEVDKQNAEGTVYMWGGSGASLDKLSLGQDGQIEGVDPSSELYKILHAKTPEEVVGIVDPDLKSNPRYSPDLVNGIYAGIENEIDVLKTVLAAGPDNIPDLSGALKFSGGHLTDLGLDVKV